MAEHCEIFAATMNGLPEMLQHVISAGRGKLCYNVECHVNHGCTDMHQPVVDLGHLLRDLLPQLGAGIKGFMFWQYRPEILGQEAPAWGLVKPDGSARPVTEAVREFWGRLRPHAAELRNSFPAPADTGLWRSRKNEIFHFCVQGGVDGFNAGIKAYIQALYWDNIPHRLVNDAMLAAGELDGLKVLLMPSCYYVTQEEAEALDRWVRAGGVLLCETHLAGYNGTTGRHSRTMPGCGLAESWGIRETDSTSSFHLRLDRGQTFKSPALPEDVRKALKEFRSTGGEYFPIRRDDGTLVWGAHRYAELEGDGLEPLGTFDGSVPCVARKSVEKGSVYYCGTNLGQAAEGHLAGLSAVLRMVVTAAGIKPTGGLRAEVPGTVHVDILRADGRPRFAVVVSKADREQTAHVEAEGRWQAMFSGITWELNGPTSVDVPADFVEIFRIRTPGTDK